MFVHLWARFNCLISACTRPGRCRGLQPGRCPGPVLVSLFTASVHNHLFIFILRLTRRHERSECLHQSEVYWSRACLHQVYRCVTEWMSLSDRGVLITCMSSSGIQVCNGVNVFISQRYWSRACYPQHDLHACTFLCDWSPSLTRESQVQIQARERSTTQFFNLSVFDKKLATKYLTST